MISRMDSLSTCQLPVKSDAEDFDAVLELLPEVPALSADSPPPQPTSESVSSDAVVIAMRFFHSLMLLVKP